MRAESLEPRLMLDGSGDAFGAMDHSPWQNPVNAMDVNQDMQVTPLDVLVGINALNNTGPGALADLIAPPILQQQMADASSDYLDPNGDGSLTPLDILSVINYQNNGGTVDDALQAAAPATDEHADTPGEDATRLELVDGYTTVPGFIDTPGDVDVFQLTTDAGRLAVNGFGFGVPAGVELTVLNSDLDAVAASNAEDPSGFSPDVIDIAVDQDRLYYIVVSGTDANEVGDYVLDVFQYDDTQWIPDADSELGTDIHADVPGDDATTLEFETGYAFVSSYIDTDDDRDVFQVGATADVLDIFVSAADGNSLLDVQVFDSDGNVLTQARGFEFGAYLSVPGTEEPRYISISAVERGATGQYILDVFQYDESFLGEELPPLEDDHVDEVGDDATLIELVEGYGFGQGFTHDASDVDVFQFSLSEADTVLIAGMAFPQQVTLQVLGNAGNVLAEGQSVETFDEAEGFVPGPTPVEVSVDLEVGSYFIAIASPESTDVVDYGVDVFVGEPIVEPPPPGEEPPPLEDDHADEVGEAATVVELTEGYGLSFGMLGEAGDIDVFQFATEETSAVNVLAESYLEPITLEIRDGENNVLATGHLTSGGEPGQPAYLDSSAELDAGTYYAVIAADGEDPNVPLDYAVNVMVGNLPPIDEPPSLEDDHADEVGEAATLIELVDGYGFGYGFTHDASDVDVFQFSVSEADAVLVAGWAFPQDVTLQVLDESGNVLADGQPIEMGDVVVGDVTESEDMAPLPVPVEASLDLDAGTYFIAIASPESSEIVDYSVDVIVGEPTVEPPGEELPPLEDDHADEVGDDATLIELVDGYGFGQGFTHDASDVDVFQFTVAEADTVLVAGWAFPQDVTLQVLDEAGSVLADGQPVDMGDIPEDVSVPTPVEASLDLDTGTYFIAVASPESTELVDYGVDVFVGEPTVEPLPPGEELPPLEDDHADEVGDAATVVDLTDGFGFSFGMLGEAGDVDVFQFTIEEAGPVVVLADSISGPVTLEIRDGDDNVLAVGQLTSGGEPGQPAYLIAEATLEAGTYYAVIAGDVASGSLTEYALNVDKILADFVG